MLKLLNTISRKIKIHSFKIYFFWSYLIRNNFVNFALKFKLKLLFEILDFQNYLRTQTGNNTTVNIIISTVDYLLRVQVG